ncbi:MAG: DsbA family protein [Alphaproteobacteria bacterium]|nr:DsbA family protein [Alphaproteobacteria bacterium]
MPHPLTLWLDCRSPYSYLAKDPAYALERDYDVALDIKPYTIELAAAANLSDAASVARGMRKIKYLYMDARRFANPRQMTILGPKKIFDGALAHLGLLYAGDNGRLRPYLDAIYPRFFERKIDIEKVEDIEALLRDIGLDPAGFAALRDGEGPARLKALTAAAEAEGAFGVPSFVLDGELFWGHDRMELLRARLAEKGLRRAS